MSNALDKIATNKATKVTSTRAQMDLPDNIRKAVDRLIEVKSKVKEQLSEEEKLEKEILDYVKPKQDKEARAGHYNKSYELRGASGALLYSAVDKFSAPQAKDLQAKVSELITEVRFHDFFDIKRAVTVKPDILANDELVNTIVETLEAKGIGNIFEVVDSLFAKKGLDVRQYELAEDVHTRFREMVPQASPFLKGVS